MQLTLLLSKSDLEQLYHHAESCLPLESVALVFGKIEDTVLRTTRIEYLENSADSRVRFAVEPEEQYRLLIEAEERDEEMIGVFHSHPAPPRPSDTDVHYMRVNPVVWLIASKLTGEWVCAAFILEDDEINEVMLSLDE